MTTATTWIAGYDHDGVRIHTATIGGVDYLIVRDGAGSTPWRAECSRTWFDATFETLREAKFAAEQNAQVA